MKHTSYFIEHILAGLGALTWIILILITFVDINWTNIVSSIDLDKLPGYLSLNVILFIPFIYITGIVVDRLVDEIFDRIIGIRVLQKNFDTKDEYTESIARIFYKSQALRENYEYGRMRIRICRAWAYNSLMCMIAFNLFFFFRFEESHLLQQYISTESTNVNTLSIYTSMFYLTSFLVSFRAWYTLSNKECKVLKAQNKFLENS